MVDAMVGQKNAIVLYPSILHRNCHASAFLLLPDAPSHSSPPALPMLTPCMGALGRGHTGPGILLVGPGIQRLPKCRRPVLRSYRPYRSVVVPALNSYGNCRSLGHRISKPCTEPYPSARYGVEAVPNHFGRLKAPSIPLPRCRIPVSRSYQTFQIVGYRY